MRVNKLLIGKLAKICYQVSTETKTDVFFDYCPHVNEISVRVYDNGWDSNKPDYDKKWSVYTEGDLFVPKNVDKIWEIIAVLQNYLKGE